jgi:hypothetical protein
VLLSILYLLLRRLLGLKAGSENAAKDVEIAVSATSSGSSAARSAVRGSVRQTGRSSPRQPGPCLASVGGRSSLPPRRCSAGTGAWFGASGRTGEPGWAVLRSIPGFARQSSG